MGSGRTGLSRPEPSRAGLHQPVSDGFYVFWRHGWAGSSPLGDEAAIPDRATVGGLRGAHRPIYTTDDIVDARMEAAIAIPD